MTVLSAALAIRRLGDDNATLRMLRAGNLAIMAAVLGEHLGTPGSRIATDSFHELIDADLQVLREHFEVGNRTAKAYCDDWRSNGVLLRRAGVGARGETYELSAAGFDAIRIIDQLTTPRSTLTESRLKTLAQSLQTLAIDTDPDATKKLRALEQQRDRIDAEITRIRSGEVHALDSRAATERVTDILLQAQGLPADFARVRARFEDLNHELRVAILDLDEHQSNVIIEIFRGVDLIAESDEGRTFNAFSALIRDPESSASFESHVRDILSRDFAAELPADSRRAIRNLLREMKKGSRDVQASLTEFARGLRRYVRSQEYQRDRALRSLLQEALAAAVPARTELKPYNDIGMELELTVLPISSIGGLRPHDPSEYETGAVLGDAETGEVDLASLALIARESEIDFTELITSVNELIDAAPAVDNTETNQNTAAALHFSVAEVLAQHPATQGLASVVGLLALASRHGQVNPDETETLIWQGLDMQTRSASVTSHFFTERIKA